MIDGQRIKQRAKLIRPLLVPFVLYIGLLALSVNWLDENPLSSWRIVIAALPIFPAIFIATGTVQVIQKLDEMERRIILEAVAISFICSFLVFTGLGLLDMAWPLPLNGVYASLLMAAILIIAKLVIQRKYK